MCRTITGDAPLFTLFRVDTQSIRCPIQGPLHFSYDFGRGLCAYPLSKLESCTIDTRISLKYQACPNVPGSEMKGIHYGEPNSYDDTFHIFQRHSLSVLLVGEKGDMAISLGKWRTLT